MTSEATTSEPPNFPIVLVMSDSKDTTPQSIINELRKLPETENTITVEGHPAFKHSISTKYYKTEILFLPFENSVSSIPATLKLFVEGLILYFDAKNRNFLTKLESYADFLEGIDVEFGLLLCDHIFDDEKDGITYREAKQHSKILDLIELNPESDDAGGYEEVHRAMNNTIWSNAEMNEAAKPKEKKKMSDQEMELKLESFEQLLAQAMSFKVATQGMGRNERLHYAEQFAECFESIFGEESDDDEDDK